MVLVALLAAPAPGCLAGEAAALSRLLPARPQRPPPGQGSARYPHRVLGRVGRCSPPRNPTRAIREGFEPTRAVRDYGTRTLQDWPRERSRSQTACASALVANAPASTV